MGLADRRSFWQDPLTLFHSHSPPWVGTALLEGAHLSSSWPEPAAELRSKLPNVGQPLPKGAGNVWRWEGVAGLEVCWWAEGRGATKCWAQAHISLRVASLMPKEAGSAPQGTQVPLMDLGTLFPSHFSSNMRVNSVLPPCKTPPVGLHCGDLAALLCIVTSFWGGDSRTCTRGGHHLH